ncbi:unnamed protein product [Microthlaspi erraticum]|uniref:Uncharacterized protein n=1 Tax=Microthlaspi erraticum TaxID=1685480 RepID=A0A6D2KDP4_9BRAS|nr:unnamed protein product [Microthlaspi erraticum]
MADGVKFGRSRASKMADNPNHGIYRGHRLKSPQSSIHIASKEENPDWNEQNWRSSRSQFENFSKEISNHSFKRPQTSPVAILYNIGRRNFKIGRGNLHGSSCSPYHHHPVDQNGPVSAKKAKNRKPRENCHIHPTKSNSYDVCTSQFIPGSNYKRTTDLHIKGQKFGYLSRDPRRSGKRSFGSLVGPELIFYQDMSDERLSLLEHSGAWKDLAHGRSSTGYAKEEGGSHLEDQLDHLLDQPVEFLNSTGQASTRSS